MAENFFGTTNVGKIRDNNEDAFIAEQLSNGWILACVIDGVGGYEGGEVAAGIAQETIREKLKEPPNDVIQSLKETVLLANENIYKEKLAGKGSNQMACVLTMALVDVENNQFYYAHVGDTRLYLLRDESLVKVTKDHSFVGFLEDSGRLSEKEAMLHPKRNEINKALGFDAHINLKDDYVETGSSPFLPGDMLLLCSDGLSDLIDKKQMTTVLVAEKSLEEKANALIAAANNAGGKDNITVVLVLNDKKQKRRRATKPITKKNETNDEVKPVTKTEAVEEQQVTPQKKKEINRVLLLLLLLCLILAGTTFWLWSKNRELSNSNTKLVVNQRSNDITKKLNEVLASNKILNLDTLSGKIITTDSTLFVRQDTVHLVGNNVMLQGDSTFKEPAFIAKPSNSYLILENITFKNYATAILLEGNQKLQLKNVQFINCGIPVQQNIQIGKDSAFTGIIRDTINPKIDTIHNH